MAKLPVRLLKVSVENLDMKGSLLRALSYKRCVGTKDGYTLDLGQGLLHVSKHDSKTTQYPQLKPLTLGTSANAKTEDNKIPSSHTKRLGIFC